jgi:hypothetical protein
VIIALVNPASFRATVAALAFGQRVCWAALYDAYSSFVLPMQRALAWSKPQMMGAFTLGLAMWGAATYAMGAAIDRGRGGGRQMSFPERCAQGITSLTLVGGFASTLSFPAVAWLISLFD